MTEPESAPVTDKQDAGSLPVEPAPATNLAGAKPRRMSPYRSYVCGPTRCPNDDRFERDNYFGCVPADFSPTTGKGKTFKQTKKQGRYRWNGGCDAKGAR